MNAVYPLKIRTLFFGTPQFASVSLEALVKNNFNIIGVVTQPDRKKSRDGAPLPNPVRITSQKYKLPILQPIKLDNESLTALEALKPDLIVVVAYGKIFPQELISLPGFGCVNVHASLLPAYRGPSPIQNALLNGESVTGISIQKMVLGMDEGDIISSKEVSVGQAETHRELSQRLSLVAGELLVETLPRWVEQKILPRPQDNGRATYCQLIEKSDGHINWGDTATEIYNRYRAFFSWPGVFTFWQQSDGTLKRLKLLSLSHQDTQPKQHRSLGEVFEIEEQIGVQTGRGVLFLETIQMEGKRPLPIREFIHGSRDFIGTILK